MIPIRVKLSGFLSYKEEQEIGFNEAPLWMLSGVNGSGKSSIFDALTYALFGYHRGGRAEAAELINKESNSLAVEFDFSLDRQPYRIKRTIRRRPTGPASTQQIMSFTSGEWEPIPDTHLKARFDTWIKDQIGLDYETFTSSVLLLQGKAEKLLDSTPSGRAGVLARIVDLERYQKLHAKADEKRKELKAQLELLANQLTGIKEVSEEDFAVAVAKIEAAEKARTLAQDRVDHLQSVEMQSRRWEEAQARLAATRAKLQTAESLLSHEVAIERDFARLRELREVLPAVLTVVTERGRVGESQRNTDRLTQAREVAADKHRKGMHALDNYKGVLSALKKNLVDDEQKQAVINTRLRDLATVLEKVRQADEIQAEAKRLEEDLHGLPTDAETTVASLQQTLDQLNVLAAALPLLERLHKERTDLLHATRGEAAAREEEARLVIIGKQAKEKLETTLEELKTARALRVTADQSAAEARALSGKARQLADEFKKLSGAKDCHVCGQELSPEHFAAERKKRNHDATLALRKSDDLTAAETAAREKEAQLAATEVASRKCLEEMRDKYTKTSAEVKERAAAIAKIVDSCRQCYIGLPQLYKEKVDSKVPEDWSKVAYPEKHELTALYTEARRTDDITRQLREARETTEKVGTVRAKLESARDRLAKIRKGAVIGDAAELRRDQAAKQAEETTILKQIAAAKKEIQKTEIELDRQQRQLGEIDREFTEIAGKLNLEEATRGHSREAIERATQLLPVEWQAKVESAGLAEQLIWREESENLTTADTEGKYTKLQAARGGLDSLRAEIVGLEEEAEAFPEEARHPFEAVHARVVVARKEVDDLNRDLLSAQRQRDILDEFRRQRADLGDRCRTVDVDHNRYKILAELLGRDRLQRHLVRTAERQIVDYANSVLDRLSRGELFLRLVGAEEGLGTDKALDLEASNRATGGAPINVAFLSGSQRFRVAVALALGIGQYASKQHRPIESVIIDEGFGCLDRAGRQVMIQELQNLRGHLQCILLVSHQEEFADAFSDGYRFEMRDGSTHVTKYRR